MNLLHETPKLPIWEVLNTVLQLFSLYTAVYHIFDPFHLERLSSGKLANFFLS